MQAEGGSDAFPSRPLLHSHLETSHGYTRCPDCSVTVYVAPDSLGQHTARYHPPSSPHPPGKQAKQDPGTGAETTLDWVDTARLTEGEHALPARYTKDPLRGFFQQVRTRSRSPTANTFLLKGI